MRTHNSTGSLTSCGMDNDMCGMYSTPVAKQTDHVLTIYGCGARPALYSSASSILGECLKPDNDEIV